MTMKQIAAQARRGDWRDALLLTWAHGGPEAVRALIDHRDHAAPPPENLVIREIDRRDTHEICRRAAGGRDGGAGLLVVSAAAVRAEIAERIATAQKQAAARRPAVPSRPSASRQRPPRPAWAGARARAVRAGARRVITQHDVERWVEAPDPRCEWPAYCRHHSEI